MSLAQIDNILDKIVEVLQADPAFANVKKWYKVDGMVIGAYPAVSVAPKTENFTEITQDKDDTTADFNIYVYVQVFNPEDGEKQVRGLAHAVRDCLMKRSNRDLAALAIDSFVEQIDYLTVDAGETQLLHAAQVRYKVKYYCAKDLS